MRNTSVARQWVDTLREESKHDRALTRRDYIRLTRISRWWKQVYDLRQLIPEGHILEVGCGSGQQLISLAVAGFHVTGIDVSPEALEKLRKNLGEIEKILTRPLSVNLLLGDFARMPVSRQFPLVFSVGVIEHFLDYSERIQFLRRLAEWTTSGGMCVNYVPNGMQPLRQLMREKKLGGYNIPEIDYSKERLNEDMLEAGFVHAHVVPLDLFGYRLVLTPQSNLSWYVFRTLNLFLKLTPHRVLPPRFRERHAYVLAGIARKPLQ